MINVICLKDEGALGHTAVGVMNLDAIFVVACEDGKY